MPDGILFPLDEREPVVLVRFDELQDYQRAVGGEVEAIPVDIDGSSFFVDAEAKFIGMPMNVRATLFWWLNLPSARGADYINGPAVLVGPADRNGETLDVPEETRKLLLAAGTSFAVEVKVTGSSKWYREDIDFADFFGATIWGLQLKMHRREIDDLRVVPVDP
ncbi:DUF3846 domain-containing protein [Nocardioides sp. WG-D5]